MFSDTCALFHFPYHTYPTSFPQFAHSSAKNRGYTPTWFAPRKNEGPIRRSFTEDKGPVRRSLSEGRGPARRSFSEGRGPARRSFSEGRGPARRSFSEGGLTPFTASLTQKQGGRGSGHTTHHSQPRPPQKAAATQERSGMGKPIPYKTSTQRERGHDSCHSPARRSFSEGGSAILFAGGFSYCEHDYCFSPRCQAGFQF